MKIKKLKDLAKDKKKIEVDLNKFKFQKGEDIATRMAKLKGKFIPQEDIDKYATPEEKEFLKEIGLKIPSGWNPKVPGGKMGEIHPPGSVDRPFHPVKETGWKSTDAYERVSTARSGSLSKDFITYDYLVSLRMYVYEWLEEIESELSKWK